MKPEQIIGFPTTHNNVHESVYRSYHILEYVLLMVERGDSRETIYEMAELLRSKELTIKE